MEKAANVIEMARSESILNSKLEISVMRKQTSEVYTVTHDMKILTNRMEKLISKEDSFLVEVKEHMQLRSKVTQNMQ